MRVKDYRGFYKALKPRLANTIAVVCTADNTNGAERKSLAAARLRGGPRG